MIWQPECLNDPFLALWVNEEWEELIPITRGHLQQAIIDGDEAEQSKIFTALGYLFFKTNRYIDALEYWRNEQALREKLGDLEGLKDTSIRIRHAFAKIFES